MTFFTAEGVYGDKSMSNSVWTPVICSKCKNVSRPTAIELNTTFILVRPSFIYILQLAAEHFICGAGGAGGTRQVRDSSDLRDSF